MQKVSSKKLCEIVDSASVVVDVDIENIVSDSRAVNKGDYLLL